MIAVVMFLGALVVPCVMAVKGRGYRGAYLAAMIVSFLLSFFLFAISSGPYSPPAEGSPDYEAYQRGSEFLDAYGSSIGGWFLFAGIGTLLAACLYRKPSLAHVAVAPIEVPTSPAPEPAAPLPVEPWEKRLPIIMFGLIGTAAIVMLVTAMGAGSSTTASDSPAAADAAIDSILNAARTDPEILSRFGPPDRDESSENEWPKVFIATRVIEYRKAGIRAIYVPDAKGGTPPPYNKWKLASFTDTRANKTITANAAIARLMAEQR